MFRFVLLALLVALACRLVTEFSESMVGAVLFSTICIGVLAAMFVGPAEMMQSAEHAVGLLSAGLATLIRPVLGLI
jgi:hypothetical protein